MLEAMSSVFFVSLVPGCGVDDGGGGIFVSSFKPGGSDGGRGDGPIRLSGRTRRCRGSVLLVPMKQHENSLKEDFDAVWSKPVHIVVAVLRIGESTVSDGSRDIAYILNSQRLKVL
jgi:hypothetical protein